MFTRLYFVVRSGDENESPLMSKQDNLYNLDALRMDDLLYQSLHLDFEKCINILHAIVATTNAKIAIKNDNT